MTIKAILDIFVLCDSHDPGIDCHVEIDNSADLIIDDVSVDSYHTWLEERGWLVIGEMAYCPTCRFQLHD